MYLSPMMVKEAVLDITRESNLNTQERRICHHVKIWLSVETNN